MGQLRAELRLRWRARRPRVALEQVQRRLELQLTALYGRPVSIAASEESGRGAADGASRSVWQHTSTTDGVRESGSAIVRLPRELAARSGDADAIARYRLFAIEQAERIARGTAAHVPFDDPLERDLFLLREASSVDAKIARAFPGIRATLEQERRIALERRPALDKLSRAERDVELMVRDALARPADDDNIGSDDPRASRDWARQRASQIRKSAGQYRGVPPAALWGTMSAQTSERGADEGIHDGPKIYSSIQPMTGPIGLLDMETRDSRAAKSDSSSGERDADAGDPDARPSSKSHDDAGARKRDDATSMHDREHEGGAHGNEGPGATGSTARSAGGVSLDELPPASYYDEWDGDRMTYINRAVAVRSYEPGDGDPALGARILRDHAVLLRQIRQQFERLRARRLRLDRQRSGDDIDIAACVEAIIQRRLGDAPDDRLYLDSRPARRGMAIALLADASGSTKTLVSDTTRVIDIERIALLLAAEALDALGDLYGIYTFAGESADNVRLTTLKRFDQRNGPVIRGRLSGIEPGGFTRLGAAIRHTTRELTRQSAGHRLLLILSDGRPNDVDAYQGTYGVVDSRQAIAESRASGVFPFCITIDAQASEYLPRIFGTASHVIVRRPSQLPSALLTVVSALIRRG